MDKTRLVTVNGTPHCIEVVGPSVASQVARGDKLESANEMKVN